MRMDSALNVTQEGSLDDLPAAVGGNEETREGTCQIPEDERGPSSNVITSTEQTPKTHLKEQLREIQLKWSSQEEFREPEKQAEKTP